MVLAVLVLFGNAYPARSATGKLWVTDGSVHSVLETNGIIYLGGKFTHLSLPTGSLVALDKITGRRDPALPRFNGVVNAIIPDGAGGWYVGGLFKTATTPALSNLVHLRADRTLDTAWNPQLKGMVGAVAATGTRVYAAGMLLGTPSNPRHSSLMVFDARSANVVPTDLKFAAAVSARGIKLTVHGKTLYVMGLIPVSGSPPRRSLTAIDTTTHELVEWLPSQPHGWGMGSLPMGGALAATDEHVLVAGFLVRNLWPSGPLQRGLPWGTGMVAINRETGLADPGFPLPARNTQVHDFALANGAVHFPFNIIQTITNELTRVLSIPGPSRIATVDLATKSLSVWHAEPRQNDGQIGVIERLAASGNTVWMSGWFTSIKGQPRRRLAAFRLTTGELTSWNPGLGGIVNTMVCSEESVWVGGHIFHAGGASRVNLAAINSRTGEPLDWNSQPDGAVTNLVWLNGMLRVEGQFTNIGGQSSSGAAWLNPVTGQVVAGAQTLALKSRTGVSANRSGRSVTLPSPRIQLSSSVAFIEVRTNGDESGRPFARESSNQPDERFILEASTNLVDWVPLSTNQAPFIFEDLEAGKYPYRFYRAIQAPSK